MAEKKATAAQNTLEDDKVYKVISNGFKSRNEAEKEVVLAKTKGIMPVIIIEGSTYKVFYAEAKTKTAADELLKVVKEKGMDAVISAVK